MKCFNGDFKKDNSKNPFPKKTKLWIIILNTCFGVLIMIQN